MSILRSLLGLDEKTTYKKPEDNQEARPKAVTGVSEALRPFLAFMEVMAESLATERIEELTLREAITRFVEGKPKQFEPAKGALIVQPHREGKLVYWAFLNSDNSMMCGEDGKAFGRKAICSRLDAELVATLKGNELLIVE